MSLPGSPGAGAGGNGGIVRCIFYEAGQSSGGVSEVPNPVAGEQYQVVCFDASGQVVYSAFITYNPAAPVTPGTLARQAWKQLPLVFPPVATSPAIDAAQYVHLPTWLWIRPGEWVPQSATAEVPGLSATVTATPLRVEWSLGDGSTMTCGPGTPYDASRPAKDQTTACSHVFDDASSTASDGVFHASATMWWSVSWTATDGSSGSLPDAFRSTRFDLRVEEIQALRQGDGA